MKHARSDYDTRIQDSAGMIPDDEPVLFVRGQDNYAVPCIEKWIECAQRDSADPALVAAVERHRDRIILWQTRVGSKTPDVPPEALEEGE